MTTLKKDPIVNEAVLQIEKDKLKELILPAIELFMCETGMMPNISVKQTSQETRCGTIKGKIEVEINCII